MQQEKQGIYCLRLAKVLHKYFIHCCVNKKHRHRLLKSTCIIQYVVVVVVTQEYCRFIYAAVNKILVEYLSQPNTVNTSLILYPARFTSIRICTRCTAGYTMLVFVRCGNRPFERTKIVWPNTQATWMLSLQRGGPARLGSENKQDQALLDDAL